MQYITAFCPVLLVLLPLFGTIPCFVSRSRGRLCSIIYIAQTFASSSLGFFCFIVLKLYHGAKFSYVAGGFSSMMGIELQLNFISGVSILAISIVSFVHAITVLSANNVQNYVIGLYMILISGCNGLLLTNDLFNSYVFFEVVSVTSIAIYTTTYSKKILTYIFDYLIVSGISGVFILFGIFLLYNVTHQLNFQHIHAVILDFSNNIAIKGAYIFFVIGLLLKLGVCPMHRIVGNLYQKTNPSLMILLSILSGVYSIFLIKVIANVFGVGIIQQFIFFNITLQAVAIIGMVIFAVKLFYEKNFLHFLSYLILAYDSVFMFCLVRLNENSVYAGIVMLLTANILTKAGSFAMINVVNQYAREKDINMENIINVIGSNHFLKIIIILYLFCIAGMPITLGFVAKISILIGMLSVYNSIIFTAILIAFIATISLVCMKWCGQLIYNTHNDDVSLKSPIKIPYKPLQFAGLCLVIILLFISPFLLKFMNFFI